MIHFYSHPFLDVASAPAGIARCNSAPRPKPSPISSATRMAVRTPRKLSQGDPIFE
jgi:hypothetical protein